MKNSKLRLKDEEILSTFKEIKVYAESGESGTVPIIFGDTEKAVVATKMHKVENKDDLGLIKEKVRLPLLALNRTSAHIGKAFYTLHAYSLFYEDMNQMIEQVISKFGNNEGSIQLDLAFNNESTSYADSKKVRVVHWTFNFSADIDFSEE